MEEIENRVYGIHFDYYGTEVAYAFGNEYKNKIDNIDTRKYQWPSHDLS